LVRLRRRRVHTGRGIRGGADVQRLHLRARAKILHVCRRRCVAALQQRRRTCSRYQRAFAQKASRSCLPSSAARPAPL